MSDSKLTVKDPDEDLRGRKVVDKAGVEIGVVNDLLLDDRESKVRFLRVGSGGILGLGVTQALIPVDAITKVTAEAVQIDHTHAHVAGGPGYDVALTPDRDYWGELYGYYGYSPHGHPNYMHPATLDIFRDSARDGQTS
jgi:sporulation protein YlmC with PRC-barrel domain